MTESQLPQPVTVPTAIRPVDRHELGDAIRRAWLKHGQDSWLTIADEVFAALAEPEPEGPTHRITPDDFRRWWRETGSASPAPSPEMLLTANAWAQYCLDRWGNSQGILDTSTAP